MVSSDIILQFFNLLNNNNLLYVLIKNDGGKIPYNVEDGKDVDFLIHPSHYNILLNLCLENGYRRLPGESKKYFFLYKLRDDIFICKNDAYFHIYDKLACNSFTNMGLSKIPLDNKVQQYIWSNRIWDTVNSWWKANDVIVLISLIVKSIFDKKCFRKEYIYEIELRSNLLDNSIFTSLCETIFFNYTDKLIFMLKGKKYDKIILDYQHFVQY